MTAEIPQKSLLIFQLTALVFMVSSKLSTLTNLEYFSAMCKIKFAALKKKFENHFF